MAWDTAATQQKILTAAVAEFAEHGPDGTTVERIARAAGVNKERVYNYFGDKRALFAVVLREELASVARDVPISAASPGDIGEYAGRVYDCHRAHPQFSRLLRWEGLVFDAIVPDEAQRREHYRDKVEAVTAGQRSGAISSAHSPDQLVFLIFAIAGWWSAVPQVARMISGPVNEQEHARRRDTVVRAASELATPQPAVTTPR